MLKSFWKTLLVIALVFAMVFLMVPPLWASLGKIAGTVKDAKTGEPLPGANVIIVGTTLGASADAEGRYFILNVPPGTYDVEARMMGYEPLVKTGVVARLDMTTTVDFELTPTVIEAPEAVVVVAERPAVDPTLTATRTTFDVEVLDNTLPLADIHDIVEIAASTFQGYMRGGRKYETKMLVDGVDISDTYFSGGTGAFGSGDVGHSYQGFRRSEIKETAMADVASSAIQEVGVYAGTFNAEYPTASAGIINIVTKSGGPKLRGKIFTRMTPLNRWKHFGSNVYWMKDSKGDNVGYFDEKQQYLDAGTVYGKRAAALYTWTEDLAREKYYYDPEDSVGLGRSYEIEGNLSGPLPFGGGKGGFFFSARYQRIRPTPLPFDINKRISASLKLHYDLAPDKRITLYGQLNDGGKLFNFVNWKFNPKWAYYMEGAPRYKDLALVGYTRWTQTLSPKTFYEVQISQSNKTNWIGYPDDNGDGYCDIDEKGDFIEFKDMAEYLKYVGGVIKTDTVRDEAGNIISIETYIDRSSLTGYRGNWYAEHPNEVLPPRDPNRVFFYETIDPSSGVNEAKPNFWNVDGWYRTAYPAPLYSKTTRNVTTFKGDLTSQITYNHQLKTGFQFRYHTVDVNHKMSELGGSGRQYPYSVMHVDIHKFHPKEFAFYAQDRIEYKGMILNVGARIDGYDNGTRKFKNDFHPWDVINYPSGNLKELKPARGDKVGWKWYFSPRIGVSHPIAANMAMHYSFGKFVQYPNFASLYTDYNFTNYSASPSMVSVWVDQDPIRSTAYEIGLQYSPVPDIVLNSTVYYRDVENYSKLTFSLTPYAGQGLRLLTSWGHADSRGIELSIQKRPGKWWSGQVTYAYSYIKAAVPRGGAEESQRISFSASADSSKFAELPIERGESYNYREENIVVRSTANPLAGGFDRTHRFTGSLMFFLPYGVRVSTVAEAMSGFKYWPTENIENDPYFDVSPKMREGPWNYWINLRLSWEGLLSGLRIRPFVEIRNLTDHKNILAYNRTPFMEAKDQTIFEIGRDFVPKSGDEPDPEGYRKVPHDTLGRLLYGPARQAWIGVDISF